jgi:hypothetical protein
MVLAPAFSGSIFQHLRSEKKSPRRASSRRGFQLSAKVFQKNQGTSTALHYQPRKNQQPRDSIFESMLKRGFACRRPVPRLGPHATGCIPAQPAPGYTPGENRKRTHLGSAKTAKKPAQPAERPMVSVWHYPTVKSERRNQFSLTRAAAINRQDSKKPTLAVGQQLKPSHLFWPGSIQQCSVFWNGPTQPQYQQIELALDVHAAIIEPVAIAQGSPSPLARSVERTGGRGNSDRSA